jgi:two-component system, OmpR family, response regulator
MNPTVASESRPRVLLVEDDGELRSLLTRELAVRGYDVIGASTGSEAIDYVIRSLIYERTHSRPALIISDVRLQSGNGLSIAEAIRRASYDVPILLMTAFPGPEVQSRAATIRDCTLIAKPFDVFEFFAIVQELINRPRRLVGVAG